MSAHHRIAIATGLAIAGALAAGPAGAAITANADGLKTFLDATGGSSTKNIDASAQSGFDPFGADKLVVTLSCEGQGGLKTLTSISYNGTTLNPVVSESNSGELVGIYYADLDGTLAAGTLTMTFSGNINGVGGSLIALNGTAPGFGATAQVDGLSTTIDASAGSFVIAHAGTNDSGPVTPQPDLTPLLLFGPGGGTGSATGGSGYQFVSSANSNLPITFVDGGYRNPATVAAEFDVIPEPCTLALLGLGGLLVARRRRGTL